MYYIHLSDQGKSKTRKKQTVTQIVHADTVTICFPQLLLLWPASIFIGFLLLEPPLLSFSIREFDSLNEEDHAGNLQLAFDISEREFGIRPFTSVKELSDDQELDKTRMITYLSKFYELFRGTPLPTTGSPLYSTMLYSTALYCGILIPALPFYT